MRYGLFTKLSIALIIITLLNLLALAYLFSKERRQQVIDDRTRQAIGQVKTLANGSLDALITKDYQLLKLWVSSVMPADFYRYAYLSSPNGLILTHSDDLKIGQKTKALSSRDIVQKKLVHHSRLLNEVSYPAFAGKKVIAYAHLAWSEEDIKFINNSTLFSLLSVFVLFLMIHIPASMWVVRRYSAPFDNLTNAIDSIVLGESNNKPINQSLLLRQDEIGQLANAFEKLSQRLNLAWEEIQGEEQRLHSKVNSRTAELRESNEELEFFSYSISNDLQLSMRSINNYSLALLKNSSNKLSSHDIDYLFKIRDGSNRMSNLINGLLDLSRVARANLDLQVNNLTDLVSNSLDALQQADSDRKVSFHISENIEAKCDYQLIKIVLTHLLSNAWKFSSNTSAAVITFSSVTQDDQIVYSISDNGLGFDMENYNNLFRAFHRMHKSTELNGIGIGLATVHRIIRRHGGTIWAEAVVGQGATFFFTLG